MRPGWFGSGQCCEMQFLLYGAQHTITNINIAMENENKESLRLKAFTQNFIFFNTIMLVPCFPNLFKCSNMQTVNISDTNNIKIIFIYNNLQISRAKNIKEKCCLCNRIKRWVTMLMKLKKINTGTSCLNDFFKIKTEWNSKIKFWFIDKQRLNTSYKQSPQNWQLRN